MCTYCCSTGPLLDEQPAKGEHYCACLLGADLILLAAEQMNEHLDQGQAPLTGVRTVAEHRRR
jgi:hypothetical protein